MNIKPHDRNFHCPICDGHTELPKHQSIRCWGYTSDDHKWVRCTREEYGGRPTETAHFLHCMEGICFPGECGRNHGDRHSGHSPLPSAKSWPTVSRASWENSEWAMEILGECHDANGTVVEAYLKSRNIYLDSLPDALRFHPNLKHPNGISYPAMVASVLVWPSDTATGIHRTYLSPDGSGKAPVEKGQQRLALGPIRGGAVRLTANDEPIEHLYIGEGIETMLSVLEEMQTPCWATLGTGGLEAVVLPPAVKKVTICADNDENGAGMNAAKRKGVRWAADGIEVRVSQPSQIGDYNDMARIRT